MTFDPTYAACLKRMYSLRRFGIKLGLDLISGMLGGVGNPQHRYATIHVAGTNGKGSVAATLATILQAAGLRVGLYTSPHLVHFNERIQVNARPITNEGVVASFQAVEKAYAGDREPTFFEFTTAMALYEFARQEVDWAVIETGMGGRLDATNVLRPSLCVITNISLEHQSYLGSTLGAIAGEKAGIIKEGVPVVTGVRQKAAAAVLTAVSKERSAPLYRYRTDFRTRRIADGKFNYYGLDHPLKHLRTGLEGGHQIDNAALVLAGCEILSRTGVPLSPAHLQHGLLNTRWPGRLEIVSTFPTVLLDGAHNLAAVNCLARHLKTCYAGTPITLVTGILDDKAYPQMLRELLPLCQKAIFTQPRIDRALPPEAFLPVAEAFIPDPQVIPDVTEAVSHAVRSAAPGELICIAGSLYLVGEVKEAMESGALPFAAPENRAP
jgi:dihydrofolate synthase / folylpolyglutamate synthase